ncbi:MAG: HEAT repeat domain-containing protein [Cyanophyceae cyanobacterium]
MWLEVLGTMTEGEISAESLTLEEAIANLRSEDASLRYYAAWWVGRFRVNLPEVVAALIEGLSYTADRTEAGALPLQRNAARALGKLGDRAAVPALIEGLRSPDHFVREAAAQSLGALGDRAAVPRLLEMLAGGVAAAVQLPGKPHLNQPYDAVLEALGDLGATEAIAAIAPFLEHPMAKVQYAAARALYQLTGEAAYGERLVTALAGPDLQLRRTAMADLGAIGYLAAAPAIARTQAENSLKLYALKDLMEHPHAQGDGGDALSDDIRAIADLMDSLL